MSYSLAVHPDKSKEFSENEIVSFTKRSKLSSKCVNQILSSDSKLESSTDCGLRMNFGLKEPLHYVAKSYSTININSNMIKQESTLQNLKKENLTFKFRDNENLDKLLIKCIKEGKDFEDAIQTLENEGLIESTFELEVNKISKLCSAGSSEHLDK